MTRKLHFGARQPSGRLPAMRRRFPSTVISRFSLLMPDNSTFTTNPPSVAYTSVFGTQCPLAEPSRPPTADARLTKFTDELILVTAMSRRNYLSQSIGASPASFHFHDDLRSRAFAGMENDRAPSRRMIGGT